MYLADRELRALLPDLKFETRNPKYSFEPDSQIQSCSIDLRVDGVFWRHERRRRTIDLRRSVVEEADARRYWRRIDVNEGQAILLRPGEMLLGRVYERFTLPHGYAGKLEGRSSFARLGLMIHCAADFINPGWRGHMPLQLINLGAAPINLTPYLSICQLIVVKLTGDVERPYGHNELQSKYTDDDGGPSYWWRDKHVAHLRTSLGNRNIPDQIRDDLLPIVATRDTSVIERFDDYIGSMESSRFTNARDMLDDFAQNESSAQKWAKFWHAIRLGSGPMFIAASIGAALKPPYGGMHYLVWALTLAACSVGLSQHFLGEPPGDYLTTEELAKLRKVGLA
jgi:deoxycytidine triphosphate deaminase